MTGKQKNMNKNYLKRMINLINKTEVGGTVTNDLLKGVGSGTDARSDEYKTPAQALTKK